MSNEEGNRLIAESPFADAFMKNLMSRTKMHHDPDSAIVRVLGKIGNYHEDWNRLMPVVEKIEAIPNVAEVTIGFQVCTIWASTPSDYPILEEGNNINKKIEIVWKAVVEFIIWYNSTKPKPNEPH